MRLCTARVLVRVTVGAVAALGLLYGYALQQPDSRVAGKLLSRETRAHRLIARLKRAYDAPPRRRSVQRGAYTETVVYSPGKGTAKALQETGDAAVPGLIECLNRDNGMLRSYAASVLGDYGERAAPAVPALVDCLGETDAGVHELESVASALAHIGDPAVLPLVGRLRDAAVSRLVDQWGHEDYAVRDRVEDALVRIGGPAVVRALTELLSTEDARLREAAKHALERIRSPGA